VGGACDYGVYSTNKGGGFNHQTNHDANKAET
jgi:hypothetical protein